MKKLKAVRFLLIIALLPSCSQKKETASIIVKNTLDVERSFETVALTKDFLKVDDLSVIGIRNTKTNQLQITQTVDNDGDGIADEILFQPKIPAKSEQKYELVIGVKNDTSTTYCYSRFVPERTDDYAWENNKVAFRVFGPTAQKMVEDGVKGGTLSSGIDAWLKKVEYPIINKWYKKEIETDGTYHEDTGEGLDNFHVGISRGVGGLAIKKDYTYYYSKNYTKWKTITTGPIRTSFYLEYADWDSGGNQIKESKIISLDYGNNLSKFETTIEGSDFISAGLTLHEKDGEVIENEKLGWVGYWQPHGDSELGTAIIASSDTFLGFENYDTKKKDLSNLYANLKVNHGIVTYYAGFGWKERGEFKNKQEWQYHLNNFAKKLNNPLEIIFIE